MTQVQVEALMESSKTEAEWNANCDKVKEVFAGQYPGFWYAAIVISGLMARTVAKFVK
jgi:hypothetical protein